MAERMDSYCGTIYVDTEAESMDGHYPVGPHPYETCLAEQHRRLQMALEVVTHHVDDIRAIGERIYSRDVSDRVG